MGKLEQVKTREAEKEKTRTHTHSRTPTQKPARGRRRRYEKCSVVKMNFAAIMAGNLELDSFAFSLGSLSGAPSVCAARGVETLGEQWKCMTAKDIKIGRQPKALHPPAAPSLRPLAISILHSEIVRILSYTCCARYDFFIIPLHE